MPLNTSYTLNELQRFLSSTAAHGEWIEKIFQLPMSDASVNKPLGLIIDDSVQMIDVSKTSCKTAQPYMRDRFNPNTGVSLLKMQYGDDWQPNLDLSEIHLFCNPPNTFELRYYNAPRQPIEKIILNDRLNDRQQKYLADHVPLEASLSEYEFSRDEIQRFLRKTNAYELLNIRWEEKKLSLRDEQEQLIHFFIDCCFVLNREIHIFFTRNAEPIIIDFPKNQSQREALLEQNHQLIIRIFNIGLSGISFSSALLIPRINERKHEYSSCTYVGLTHDKKKLSSLSTSNDVIHIEPTEIQSIFLRLEKWLQTKDSKSDKHRRQRNAASNPTETNSHVDPIEQCKPLPPEEKYSPPAYRQAGLGKPPNINSQSAAPNPGPGVGIFSKRQQSNNPTHRHVDPETKTPKTPNI